MLWKRKNTINYLKITLTTFLGAITYVSFPAVSGNPEISLTRFSKISPPPCEPVFNTIQNTACGFYQFNNLIISQSGVYYDTFQNYQGCDSIVILKLTIYPLPQVDFSINQNSQCFAEQNFIFTDNSTLSGDNFRQKFWIFRNDTIYNQKIYIPPILGNGIYNIELHAITEHQCSGTMSREFSVKPSPSAAFMVNDTDQCERNNLFIYHALQGRLNYFWYFGDGTTIHSTDSFIQHSFSTSGKMLTMLIAINDSGCTDIQSRVIHVYPNPRASFEILSDKGQCRSGNYFVFKNLSQIAEGIIYYTWFWGDGSSCPDPIPTHTYYQDSIYKITLLAMSEKGCSDTTSQTVVVYPDPQTDFTYSTLCPKKEIRFTSKSTIKPGYFINSYYWEFGEKNTWSTDQNPNYLYSKPGIYLVKHISTSNMGCKSEKLKAINIPQKTHENEIKRATVVNQQILVEWLPPDSGTVRHYTLEKSYNGINYFALKQYEADVFSGIDDSCDVNNSGYFYRIRITDSCENEIFSKNISHPVLLKIDTSESFNVLRWTPYFEWNNGIMSYEVQFLSYDHKIPVSDLQDNDFVSLTTIIPDPDSSQNYQFSDNISKSNSPFYCYRIVAYRNPDKLTSASNIVCTSTPFSVFIPNSFTPNHDKLNDVFNPAVAFVSSYCLQIYNIWGEKIFESYDMNEGWDGTYLGKPCQEGVYYYHLKVKGISGIDKVYTGTLNLLK